MFGEAVAFVSATNSNRRADAHLIAAAPAMLTALQDAVAVVEKLSDALVADPDHDIALAAEAQLSLIWYRDLLKTITKATPAKAPT